MKNLIRTSILNLFLRGLSSVSKFVLIIYLAKYFSIDDLGVFGLFFSTISFAVYFLGFDFYNFNTREIILHPESKTGMLIRDQFIYFSIIYLFVLPFLIIVFQLDFLPYKYMFWFYAILLFEHISIELYRIFIAISKPVFANFIFFIKSGLWSYILIFIWILGDDSLRNLDSIWFSWFIGAFFATIISLIYLYLIDIKIFIINSIDWKWIKKGILVSIPFFISTISLKIIEFSGRYIIDLNYSKSEVGIFTFYWTIANFVNIVTFTAIIMVMYPKLIELYQKKDFISFKIIFHKFKILIVSSSIILGIILSLIIDPLISFLNKDGYSSEIYTFYVLILSNIILNFSFIPHYLLYVKEKDKFILYGTISGTILNIMLNLILIPQYGIIGSAYSILISYIAVLTSKILFNGISRERAVSS